MSTQEPAARLHIDWTRCDGRGLCTELLPELLERDEWGYPLARASADGDNAGAGSGSRSNVAIPADRVAAAQDAVNLCPLLALKLLPLRR